MRSLLILLLALALIGAAGFWVLNYLANIEPREKLIEQPVDPDLFERFNNAGG